MRMSLPFFLRSRIGRLRSSRPGVDAGGGSADPADMGTDFGLEARLAARPAGERGRAAESHGEAPLGWLGGPAARRR